LFEIPLKRVEDLLKIFIIDDSRLEHDNVGKTTIPIDGIVPEEGKTDKLLTIPLFHDGKKSCDLEIITSLKATSEILHQGSSVQ
jgi:hypothetical protein